MTLKKVLISLIIIPIYIGLISCSEEKKEDATQQGITQGQTTQQQMPQGQAPNQQQMQQQQMQIGRAHV